MLLTESRHREIALDAAALVAQLRVGDGSDGLVHVGDRQPLHRVERTGPGDLELGERRLVDQRDAFSHGAVLLGDVREPVRLPERWSIDGFDTARREPVGPLPTATRTEHGTLRC